MAWQATINTGRIITGAYAADNTAFPTWGTGSGDTPRPIAGGTIDWTETASGEPANGWTEFTFEFSEDDIEFDYADSDGVEVNPPLTLTRTALIRDKAIVPIRARFTSYEVGAKVLAMCGNKTVATNVYSFTGTVSRSAVILEVQGLGAHYFPSVEVHSAIMPGGVKALGKQNVTIEAFAGSSVTAGYQWVQWANN